ncbi:carboxylic ester hydrolase [Actinorhabdospora filicis]|uniref:Carboxylic ester hydrolase n=1 Tax=Actinorhabdospora filicis TaxID=1785913 RepID=A0A9W6STU1_9ACTN|nr:carboxylesterase family protein [Actinorhabdospora filicis]GLZ80621.1 carboxylic ester hydrolase [Actinorhabdospora filicis]
MPTPKRLLAALALGALAIGLVPAAAEAHDPSVVRTSNGYVRGAETGGLRTFSAVPYAAPPERWKSPKPAASWKGVRDATKPAPPCAQPGGLPVAIPNTNEDCLYLNVTAPADADGDTPVIVWIHGGSLRVGSGDYYGASRLAKDAVVVSVNYRLGVMSFLSDPALNNSGSLAIEDQQAALRWVRANIGAFGGDGENVTIMGQSGGGYAVCSHLASPASRGLFDRAIIESAPCAGPEATDTRAEADAYGLGVVKAVGCDTAADRAACLRSRPVDALLAAFGQYAEPRPIAGTPLLPLSPAEAFRTGRFNRVPVLLGVNHDEMNGQYAGMELGGGPLPASQYRPTLDQIYGDDAAAVEAAYPLSAHQGSAYWALAAGRTANEWVRPTMDTARLLARHTRLHVFELTETDNPWYAGTPTVSFPAGAQHMSELTYLFDMPIFAARTPKQDALAERMITAWTGFAAEGDPGWARFRTGHERVQAISSGTWGPIDPEQEHHLGFWRGL